MRTTNRQLTFDLVLAALSVAAQRQSHAQTTEAAPANQNSILTEVVVTAERRTERLMDVPRSVQAFSPEALDQKVIHNIDDLSRVAHGGFVQCNGMSAS